MYIDVSVIKVQVDARKFAKIGDGVTVGLTQASYSTTCYD